MVPKKCILLHGCPDVDEKDLSEAERTYDKHWMPWTAQQLRSRGVEVEMPFMPEPWAPNYEAFKKEFEKYEVTEDTVLVGHSCGAAFLVRWLGETQARVRKLILVAPWKIADEDNDIKRSYYEYEIRPEVNACVDEIVFFTSDTEEEDGKQSLALFREVLDGRVIELPEHGHYVFGHMNTEEFPELIDEICS